MSVIDAPVKINTPTDGILHANGRAHPAQQTIEVQPLDKHNRRLIANAHPPTWQNPTASGRHNLVVIGAGTAGLIRALGTAGLGGNVALIEHHLLGGDCLNWGCVPSKTIIRSAKTIAELRRAAEMGQRNPLSIDRATAPAGGDRRRPHRRGDGADLRALARR